MLKKKVMKNIGITIVSLMMLGLSVSAASSGSGTLNGYPCEWSVTRGQTVGSASIKTTGAPTTVGAGVKNYIYCDEIKFGGISYSKEGAQGQVLPLTGYAYVTATTGNQFRDSSGILRTGVIQQTNGSFWVNNIPVLEGVVA